MAALALVITCIPAPAQQKGFTLEQIMSSPFPSELTAAPKGGDPEPMAQDHHMIVTGLIFRVEKAPAELRRIGIAFSLMYWDRPV